MAWVREGAGVYRNTKTGRVEKGVSPERLKQLESGANKGGGGNKGGNPLSGAERRRQNKTEYVQNRQAVQNLQSGNVNTSGPFGDVTTTVDPKTGQATQTTTMSPEEQAKYNASSNLNLAGNQAANERLGEFTAGGQFNPGDPTALRDRAYNTAYDYMTRNLARDKARERQDLEQSLYNRGIAFSADPNSRYQQELGGLNERYDNQARDYAASAFLNSGSEADRMYSQNLGTHQQRLSDIGTLSGLGTGAQMPNAPAPVGASVNYGDPNATNLAFKQAANDAKLRQAQINKLNQPPASSSGSSDFIA